MHKVSPSLILALLFLPLFAVIASVARPASARQLTPTERRYYAQNNIIFTVPCDDNETDCSSTGTDSTTPGDPDTPVSPGAQGIVEFAMKYSWPDSNGQCRDGNTYVNWSVSGTNIKPEGCKNTVNDLAKSKGYIDGYVQGKTLQDCGIFVGFVLRNTVDPGAETWGTVRQATHFNNTSNKWKKVSTDGQVFPEAKLQPGDILVYGDTSGDRTAGHIKIYIGEHTVKCGNSTCKVTTSEASYMGRTPYLNNPSNVTWYNKSKSIPYMVYRYIGS